MTVAVCKDYFGYHNYSGWPGEIELKQLRTCLTYASSSSLFCPRLRQNANTTLSLQWPMKFGNIARVETSRYLTKITTWRTDRGQLKFLQPRGVRYDCHVQLVAIWGGRSVVEFSRT